MADQAEIERLQNAIAGCKAALEPAWRKSPYSPRTRKLQARLESLYKERAALAATA